MLLPDKHITLAESVLGLGGFVLGELKRGSSIDQLHARIEAASQVGRLPARHGFDSLVLAVLFLYSIGAIEVTAAGNLRRCAS